MTPMNPFLCTDGYKTGHHLMYPEGTVLVNSNFTPRSNRYAPVGCDHVVSFGQQMTMKIIDETFQKYFFERPKVEAVGAIKKVYSHYLGMDYDVAHIEALYELGYLPIRMKTLPEGTLVPMGVPVLTIENTVDEFYWLTNFLETWISNTLWKPMTSATLALQYRRVLSEYAKKTDPENMDFVDFQAHDFSMRGLGSVQTTVASGLGHATSFLGSDSLPVIDGALRYYHHLEVPVFSVNATEHSVMCAGSKEGEIETFRRLMRTFPTNTLSVVSDTWDLWKVLTEYLPELKEEILARDGKLVIRPDSGDPVDIICGDRDSVKTTWEQLQEYRTFDATEPEWKGVIELLWDIFGGTINDQGYKVLNPKIGCIYGDSITLDRAKEICERLEAKGFATTNIVLGIGSFTYQYNTRDTFGFAMKATYVEIKGECTDDDEGPCVNCDCVEGREIFKDPVTDDGTKKSAKGLLRVELTEDNEYILLDEQTREQEQGGMLQILYEDGDFKNEVTLTEVRERLRNAELPVLLTI